MPFKKSHTRIPRLYFRPPPSLAATGWEFAYGEAFCQAYLWEGLRKLAEEVHPLDTADLAALPPDALVFWLEDPLCIVAHTTLVQLLQGVQTGGYVGVAPLLMQTALPAQQAAPSFAIVNQATFEEANPLRKRPGWQLVPALDPVCGLYRAGRLQVPPMSGEVAVLQASAALSLQASTGHVREDLLAMIPGEVGEILDVGCADGGLGRRWLAQHAGGAIDGLEPEARQAAQARAHYRQVWTRDVDAFVPETLYDLIVGGDVIEHLDDPWTTLRRMWDWLRPGGYLLLSVPNAGHWSLVADQAAGRFPYLPWGLTCITHRRWFTEAELKRSLAQAGYVPQRWEREQPPASPRGEAFIRRLVRAGMGDETSLRSLQIRVLAQKI